MNVPSNLRYAATHEWIRLNGDTATVGITDHAQNELTDIVYAEPPSAGRSLKAGETAAVVESVKAASDIYSPVSGEVITGNPALSDNPALLNTDPYGEGWIFQIRLSDPTEVEKLFSAEDYQSRIS
jgi:glycine cleavage system H protein